MRISDLLFLFAPLVLGLGSSVFVPYKICGLKPKLQPPGWVFGVGWSILYFLLGILMMKVWIANKRTWSNVLKYLCFLLFLLISWWIVFASICVPVIAFMSILVVTAFSIWCFSLLLKEKNRLNAWLILPLIIWLFFASYLSFKTF